MRTLVHALGLCLVVIFTACSIRRPPDIPANVWTQVAQDEKGARRSSSFRYVPERGVFLLWGYHSWNVYIYGGPQTPFDENTEYDMVAFDPDSFRWLNEFPREREEEWGHALPPMYLSKFYHGITTGSYRTGLELRDGVLRPDLNIVYDQVTYDSRRKRMVYFTGGRTLAYDVHSRQWSDIGGEASAPPVLGGSLCYDPFNDEIVLAGGGYVAESGPEGDLRGWAGTWIYSCAGGEWRKLDTGGAEPPPRMATRLVCDTKNKRLVLFGGDGQSLYLADTWLYDTATRAWSVSKARHAPPPRAGHFTVHDPGSGLVIVGGGYDRDGERSDMWGYDPGNDRWVRLVGSVPTGWYVSADLAPDRRMILLTTATENPADDRNCDEIFTVRTTYCYRIDLDGLVDDTASVPPRRIQLRRALDQALHGALPDSTRAGRMSEFLAAMPTNRWVRLPEPGRAAELRTWGSCAFDTDNGRIIYWGGGHCGYGGGEYDLFDLENNTWLSRPLIPEYPARSWHHGINPHGVTFSGAPWIRHGRKIYAYDPVSRKIINTKCIYLTSGYAPVALKDYRLRDDVTGDGFGYLKWPAWSFDPDTDRWEIAARGLPGLDLTVGTPLGVMGVDHNWGAVGRSERPDMTEFRGERMVDNSVYLLDVAAGEWKKLTRDGPWPQNLYEMTALVYDSRRNRLLLHGGGEERNEMWSFDLAEGLWRNLEPSTAGGGAAPVCMREAVYLPDQDVFLTWSRQPGEAGGPATWAYYPVSNVWRRLDIPAPEGRDASVLIAQNRAVTYDPSRKLVLMVLGGEARGNRGPVEVYALKYR